MVIERDDVTQILLREFSQDVLGVFEDLEKDIIHFLETSRRVTVSSMAKTRCMDEALIQILLNILCRILIRYGPGVSESFKVAVDYILDAMGKEIKGYEGENYG